MDTSSSSTNVTEPAASRRVWDLPTRLFHWLLVAGIAGAWVTAELGPEWFEWHRRCGYTVLVLVAFRIGWGFVGPRHARFARFLAGPRRIAAALRRLPERAPGDSVGHNPLGGWSVVAMLVLAAGQALTGLFANDDIFNTGPLYGHVDDATSDRLTALHHQSFDVLLALIALHVVAVLFYRVWKRADLVRPMLTGRKPAAQVPPGEEVDADRAWLAAALVAAAAALLWYVVTSAPVAEMSYF